MNPKVPIACSKCDAVSIKKGIRRHFRHYVRLVHLSGNHSDHQLCSGCTFGPSDIPELWRRQCMLYGSSLPSTIDGLRHGHRFAHDVPIGILGIYER